MAPQVFFAHFGGNYVYIAPTVEDGRPWASDGEATSSSTQRELAPSGRRRIPHDCGAQSRQKIPREKATPVGGLDLIEDLLGAR